MYNKLIYIVLKFVWSVRNAFYFRMKEDRSATKLLLHNAKLLLHDAKLLLHHAKLLLHDAKLLLHNAKLLLHDAKLLFHNAKLLLQDAKLLFRDTKPLSLTSNLPPSNPQLYCHSSQTEIYLIKYISTNQQIKFY